MVYSLHSNVLFQTVHPILVKTRFVRSNQPYFEKFKKVVADVRGAFLLASEFHSYILEVYSHNFRGRGASYSVIIVLAKPIRLV